MSWWTVSLGSLTSPFHEASFPLQQNLHLIKQLGLVHQLSSHQLQFTHIRACIVFWKPQEGMCNLY